MDIEINNIKINYVVKGNSDKKILLLHGWGSNIKLFNNMIEHLSHDNTVYALDMPGFGDSQLIDTAWNVDNYVDFIIDFIKVMKIDKLSILGHSFGGRVIIKLSNRENLPFELSKLILVDSAGILPKKSDKLSFKTRIYKSCKVLLSNKIISSMFPNALENLKKKFGSEDYKNAVPVMRDTLVKVVNEDLQPLLKNIKQPTLLIWGDKDEQTPFEDAKIMEELIPNSGIVKVEGAGHYSFLEQPILINKVLDSFLN